MSIRCFCFFIPAVGSTDAATFGQCSLKVTVTNPKSRVEKLSLKESPKGAHIVLRGAAQNYNMSI